MNVLCITQDFCSPDFISIIQVICLPLTPHNELKKGSFLLFRVPRRPKYFKTRKIWVLQRFSLFLSWLKKPVHIICFSGLATIFLLRSGQFPDSKICKRHSWHEVKWCIDQRNLEHAHSEVNVDPTKNHDQTVKYSNCYLFSIQYTAWWAGT